MEKDTTHNENEDNIVEEFHQHSIKQEKPETEEQTLCAFTFINLENMEN